MVTLIKNRLSVHCLVIFLSFMISFISLLVWLRPIWDIATYSYDELYINCQGMP